MLKMPDFSVFLNGLQVWSGKDTQKENCQPEKDKEALQLLQLLQLFFGSCKTKK